MEVVKERRTKVEQLKQEADRLKKEADSLCLQGTLGREVHGSQSTKHKELLDQAAAKAREARRRDNDVSMYQDLADNGEKNAQRLYNLLLESDRLRGELVRDEKERKEG